MGMSARREIAEKLIEKAQTRRGMAERFRGMSPPHPTGIGLLGEARGLEEAAALVLLQSADDPVADDSVADAKLPKEPPFCLLPRGHA